MFKLEKQTDKAVLTIYGYVGGMYLDFRAVNSALDEIATAGYTKLDFHIHTYGGSVFEGNLIYNFIAGFKGEVDIYIDGVAASMGSVIMMAGVRIHIVENGFIMLHAPQGGAQGTAKQLEQSAKLLRSIEKNFRSKLIERTGKTEQEVAAWMDGTDYWYDADEAIAERLADDKFASKAPIPKIEKEDLSALGAEGVYNKFTACLLSQEPIIKSNMNKEALIARYGLTTVNAQSSDEDIMAAIDAKIKAGDDTAKAVTKKAIEAQVDKAIEEGKITKEQRESYVARGEKLGIDELNAIFADMKAYQSISSQLGDKGTGGGAKGRESWTFDDYQAKASAELEAMPTANPDKFKQLYKAKYGVDPEV